MRHRADFRWALIIALVAQILFQPAPVSAAAVPTQDLAVEQHAFGMSELSISDGQVAPEAMLEQGCPLPGEIELPRAYGPQAPPPAPPAAPPARPLSRDIPLSLLTVQVLGPAVASLGSPPGAGEVYTAVIRNGSSDTAYGLYLTATHQAYFLHDGGDDLISGSLSIPITVITQPTSITWTPVNTLNLAPGEVITLHFRLRATCAAQSGQQMRVGVRYNADPPPETPDELNDGGLNITTGRGNLVIRKDPALQQLGSPDFGQPITWIVTVQNTGLGILYGATITDSGGINLGQPGGDLTPAVQIPQLGINEVQTYTVVGTVEACNFTNVAQGAWRCGNLVGDATDSDPVESTASVLFSPQVPEIHIDTSLPFAFPYCAAVTRTMAVTVSSMGGPAANFRLESTLGGSGFLEVVPGSVSPGWSYSDIDGVFTYQGGSPTGTILAAGAGQPVTLTFDVQPQSLFVCSEGSGQVTLIPRYEDVCEHNPFAGDPATIPYQYAQGENPTLRIEKEGPAVVASGEVFTFVVTVSGDNPANIDGTVYVTDILPAQFALQALTSSAGAVTGAGQDVYWSFDPPDTPAAFSETLSIQVRAVITEDVCGASLIVANDAEAFARSTCPGCPPLEDTAHVETAITNNEGVFPAQSRTGVYEACGTGFVMANSYLITGSTVITWNGAVFTEALGTDVGGGYLPGPTYLYYVTDSLSVTIDGVDYTAYVTPVTSTNGPLVIDLSPLDAAGAPTQALTLYITYTVGIPEAALNGAVEQTFHDWSQLFLPDVSENQACAQNNAFNQVQILTIGRGDLSLGLSPQVLDKCSTNTARIHVYDDDPARLTDHVVITFTSSSAEIASARNFTTSGGLPDIALMTVVTDPDIGGGLGIITFTFPAAADVTGDGEIRFDVDINCLDEADWQAGIRYQSRCDLVYGDTASLSHVYRQPSLLLFATPIRYTVREKDVLWKFFIANNGNLTATNVLVTNTIYGLSVVGYAADDPARVSVSGTLPIADPHPVVFEIDQLAPGEQREVTVTAQISSCNPLHVVIDAWQGCLGSTCNADQEVVEFYLTDPYLLTNNGETADLPMCDPGEVIFTTKNASADVTLYQLDITETLRALTPLPGAPMTVTIEDESGAAIATTTAFTPQQVMSPTGELQLVWRAISATTDVITWFQALPPLHVVRIQVPVETSCVPPNTPQSWAEAVARGPCNNQLGYTEDAVTLQTLAPDMDVVKDGRVPGGAWGNRVNAGPGETVVWRLRVYNHLSSQSYVAHNVVLSDTWPDNFTFVTATLGYTPTVVTSSRTITWDIGDMAPAADPLEFYITGTVAVSEDACIDSTINATQLTFGCDSDGCTSSLSPQDTAQMNSEPILEVLLVPDPLQTCLGDIPIVVRNYGSAAYSNTLTVTLPSPGYVYSETVDAGLAPSQTITTDPYAPVFRWDVIPGRTGPDPYEFTMTLRVRNSGASGVCPVANGVPVTAVLEYDNALVCALTGPYSTTAHTLLDVLEPNLAISKLPRVQTVDVGEWITWTLVVTNAGPGIAEQMVVTDVAGSNYTSLTASPGSDGVSPIIAGNTITWRPDDIPAGGTWTATVSGLVANTGFNRNVVTVTAGCATGCETAQATDVAYSTLLQEFTKTLEISSGTIGSLMVYTFTTFLPDVDGFYEDLTITDTLPAGLGYVSSVVTYTYDGDAAATELISTTPTISQGLYAPGDVVWRLGDLSGTVQIDGVITAVIRDDPAAYDGAVLSNDMRMTYTDDGQPYVYTSTADVEVLEPILHLGKSYVTPRGCGATLLQESFNVPDTTSSPFGHWSRESGNVQIRDGMLHLDSSGDVENGTVLADFSLSFMARRNPASTGDLWVLFRATGNFLDDNYRLTWSGNSLQLSEYNSGSLTGIGTSASLPGMPFVWRHFEIRAYGPRIEIYVDGVLAISVIDDSHTSGYTQIRTLNGSDYDIDDILITRFGDTGCWVGANDLVTYTLTLSNQARLPGYDLAITDTIPAGMSLWSYTVESDDPASTVTGSPAVGDTGTLVWTVDQLTATAPFDPLNHTALTLTVVLTVSDGITANIVLPNQAALSYDGWQGSGEPVPEETRAYSGGSHSTAVRTVNGGTAKDVRFSPPPTATLGTVVTYTVIVPAQPITATLYDVVVTDEVDSRLYIEGVDTGGGTGGTSSWSGQRVTATFASIPHGTRAYVTVTARISHEWPTAAGDANAFEVITNSAVMTHATADEITRTNTVSTEVGEPDVTVVKSVETSTAITTDLDGMALLTYTLRLENAGSSAAYSLHITDAVPAGISVTMQYGGDAQSGPVVGAGTLTWTVDTLSDVSPNNVVLLTYTARISRALSGELLTNTVGLLYHSLTETIPGVRPYTDTDEIDVETAPPSVGKGTDPSTVRVGDLVTYHLVFTIPAGTVGMGGSSYLVDTLPPGVWAISGTEALSWTPGAVDAITFSNRITGTVGASEVVTWTWSEPITSVLDTPTVVTLTFQAQATGVDADGAEVWAPYDAIHGITNRVALYQRGEWIGEDDADNEVIQPDLDIAKESDPPSGSVVARGEILTYTLTITNAGYGPAYDLVITDRLPVGIDYVRTFSAPYPSTAVITTEVDGQWITYTVSELSAGPGATMVITIVAQVTDTIAANLLLTNTAVLTSYDSQPGDGPGPHTPDEREYEDGEDDVVHLTVEPSIAKVVQFSPPPTATLGTVVTYTLVVPAQPINATLYNVVVTDEVDSRLYIEGVDTAGGTGDASSWSGQRVTATFASIPPGTRAYVTVTARISDPLGAVAGDILTNTGFMTHATSSVITRTNEVTTPVSEPQVEVTKTARLSDDPHVAVYTLTVSNDGSSTAYSLIVTDNVPAGLSIAQVSQGGTWSAGDQTITWTLSQLDAPPAAGHTVVLTYAAQIEWDIYAGAQFTNTVLVRSTSLTDTIPGVRHYVTDTEHVLEWPLGRLGDYVWYDLDYDGIQGTHPGELALPGVVIDLYDGTSGSYISSTTTDGSGFYLFEHLPLDVTYTVRISDVSYLPGGPLAQYTQTLWTVGSATPATDSNAAITQTFGGLPYAITTTLTPVFTEDLTLDYGFVRLVEVGNYVWFDEDNDGLQDDVNAFGGVTLTVRYPDGRVFTTTTTADGYYTFTVPISQVYTITVLAENFAVGGPLETYTHTLINQGGNDAIDSDGVSQDGGLVTVTPPITDNNYTFDFGLVQLVSLGNQVWYDVDDDGILDVGEIGAPGVAVELYRDSDGDGVFVAGTDELISTTTTIAGGYYTFTGLYPSLAPTQTYLVVITGTNFGPGGALEGYQNSTPTVGGNSDLNEEDHGVVSGTLGGGGIVASTAVSVTYGDEPDVGDDGDGRAGNMTIDFGFYRLSLGNQVWYDDDNDGTLDGGEVGAAGIEVRLYDVTGTLLVTTTTDAGGYYTFTGLLSDTYVVGIVPPATYTSSTDIASSATPDNNVDGDDNGVDWVGGEVRSNPVTLAAGDGGALNNNDVDAADGSTHNPTVDFGLVQNLSLGNQVWYDVDDDGILDAGEIGAPGVAVELYRDSDGDGTLTPGVDELVSTTATIAGGYYTFTGLLPSRYPTETYLVVITDTNFAPGGALEGYQNSTPTVGGNSDLNEQDHGVVSGTLGGGGIVASTAVSLTVGGEPVTDGDGDANSNLTLDFGFYRLSLGNQVWYDDDNDGTLDGGEAGAAGIEVRLYDITGTLLVTTTTDAGGYYTFTGLLSDTYVVGIVPPATYTSSTDIASSATPDNNVDGDDNGVDWVGGEVRSNPVTLTAGDGGALNNNDVDAADGSTHNPTVDFGLVQNLSLGNQVWYDVDDDGILDAGEIGAPGVAVELYRDSDGDGTLTPGVDELVSTTATIAGGYYTFTGLLPSRYPTETYLVVITETNFAPGGALEGYQNSTPTVGGNSDLNEQDHGVVSGTLGGGGIVASTAVSLTVGGEPVTDGDSDANSNLTLDFGFYRLSLGNQVWYDDDNDGTLDGGEVGAAGIEVRLYDITGTLLVTTTTDAGGYYTFTGLLSDTYVVGIVPPATYTSSTDIASSATPDNNVDGDDNGVDWVGGEVRSNPVTLTAGDGGALNNNDVDAADGSTHNPTVDFGLVQYLSLGNQVWYDDGSGGGVANDGILNGAEIGVPGVAVELYRDSDGDGVLTPGVDELVSTTATIAGGYYTFTELLPSRYPTETYLVVITDTNFAPGGPLEDYVSSVPTVDGNSDLNERDHGVVSGTLGGGGIVASTPVSLTVGGEPVTDGDSDANSNLTLDFGFVRLVALGNVVWYDDGSGGGVPNDGIRNGTEAGVPGIEMRLYDVTGTLLATTTTDVDGYYVFDNLLPGDYVVHIPPSAFAPGAPLEGWVSSTGNGSDEFTDQNGQGGDENGIDQLDPATTGISSTLYTLAPDTERTFEDQSSYDGILDDDNVNYTCDFGFVPTGRIGDYVWLEDVPDGVQGTGSEAPIPGVVIDLYDADSGVYITSTTTYSDGSYLFDNLPLDVTYTVQLSDVNFVAGGALYTYTQTTLNAGTPETDSNADASATFQGRGWAVTTTLTLSPLVTEDLGLDFGFYAPLSLGDLVWLDIDNDGVYEPADGEAGIDGVAIELYQAGQTPGVDTPVLTTTTSGGGRYLFTGLGAGGYIVYIPSGEFGVGQPLEGLTSTVPTALDPNTDSNEDVDENGVPDTLGGVASGIITLTASTERLGEDVAAIDLGTPDANSNLSVDLGFYRIAGLGLVKTVAPDVVVPNMPLTYTIRIYNIEPATVMTATLTDTLPAGLHYVAGSASPMAPDAVTGSLLVWSNVGPLAPGGAVTVTLQVTAERGISGTLVNTATVRGVHAGGTLTETSDVPVRVTAPRLSLRKTLVAHDRDAGVVTFTIAVRNNGVSTLDVVPLYDLYDTAFLSFVSASPMPDEGDDDGDLTWYDLTAPAPNGFGADLAPGEQFTVTTVFGIASDITTTVNTAVITDAVDVYDNPTNEDADDEPLSDVPTAVELLYFRATPRQRAVLLEWETAVEIDHYGFALLRGTTGRVAQAVEIAFVPAAGHGRSGGAAYAYVDDTVETGIAYTYWLVDVDTGGVRTAHGPVGVTLDGYVDLPYRVYLPIITRE